jgi:DNA invertase Pin-like site-specific DNA recombinase
MQVVGYVRVSTEEQATEGASLEAQRQAITAECERRGWLLLDIKEDDRSGKDTRRPGLQEALALLKDNKADVLMVGKLDRLSRSTLDFYTLLGQAASEGWTPLALDSPVDMTTPHGEAMAGVQAVFAQLERRLIGQRTREGMAIKKAQGVHVGRRSTLPVEIGERIARERAEDSTLQAIANRLNNDNIPTGQGAARWTHATVRAVLRRLEREATNTYANAA